MISFIWAQTDSGVIGLKNKLPWRIKSELQNFKKITLNHKIIMGRKTWDGLKTVLPNRENIVVTRNVNYDVPESVKLINNISDIIKSFTASKEEIFVIGGANLFSSLKNVVNKLYVSYIKQEFPGDVYMIDIDFNKFSLIKEEEFPQFSFKIYKKK